MIHRDPYARLASVYDLMAGDPGIQAFYYEWVDSLLAAIDRHGVRVRTLVDVACGTGNSTLPWLKQHGWTVVGVDRSEAMLREARRKSKRVRWHCQELTALRLPYRADVVTCHFDALNHVLDARGLRRVFASVARLLEDGGLFQFDVNTPAALEWLGRHEKFFRVGPHCFSAFNEYDRARRIATFHQMWFVKRGRLFERREVIVQERGYPRATLRRMLVAAGFRVESVTTQRKVGGKPSRLLVVARKRPAHSRPGAPTPPRVAPNGGRPA